MIVGLGRKWQVRAPMYMQMTVGKVNASLRSCVFTWNSDSWTDNLINPY